MGFNGDLNVGLAYDENPKFNSGVNLNYRNGKVNLYDNYSNNISQNENVGDIFRPDNNSSQFFDYFKPNKSTAIQESFLLYYDKVYFALIVLTSSNKPYLYWSSTSDWNNYISAGRYSAGQSFNTYIYPNKICDY